MLTGAGGLPDQSRSSSSERGVTIVNRYLGQDDGRGTEIRNSRESHYRIQQHNDTGTPLNNRGNKYNTMN